MKLLYVCLFQLSDRRFLFNLFDLIFAVPGRVTLKFVYVICC